MKDHNYYLHTIVKFRYTSAKNVRISTSSHLSENTDVSAIPIRRARMLDEQQDRRYVAHPLPQCL